MIKSAAFISNMREVEAISGSGKITPEIFENVMTKSLLAPSPIGQEEIVRQTTGIVLDIIQQGSSPSDIEKLVNFVESFYNPIIERGRGMSFSQNLYILGLMHQAALMRTRDVRYLAAAQAYFEEGFRLAPRRPQFLYGLFDIYRIEGNFNKAREIGNKILELWPEDDRVSKILEELPEK